MSDTQHPHLRNPPIVEAVLDLDCDLPPGFNLTELQPRARAQFEREYPIFQSRLMQEHKIETSEDGLPKISSQSAVQALQFLHNDGKQLVQVRTQGFSFNRLTPYTTLDDYLPEFERTWRLYVDIVSPVRILAIRLRYINRIMVPLTMSSVDLDEYLKTLPHLPDEDSLVLSGFLSQQAAFEKDTGHQVNLVVAAERPVSEKLPVIVDITVASQGRSDPADWSKVTSVIRSLRSLKNRIFFNTLTPKCIQLFQS